MSEYEIMIVDDEPDILDLLESAPVLNENTICGDEMRDWKHPVPHFSVQLQRYFGKHRLIMIQ